jgi:D-alanine-D-alanine ligase
MGIPYTGPDVRCAAVTMDKIATKVAVRNHPDIVMARDWICTDSQSIPSDMTLPVVVKPSVGGSTIGIRKVETMVEFTQAVSEALQLHPEVLVEEFVAGDEITVAVFDDQALPVVRILLESGFFDFEAKYTDGKTVYEVPAAISARTTVAAQKAAFKAYHLLNCRGLARADFIVRDDGVPVFLELNTIPGMTETSLSPMAAAEAGTPFDLLVEKILLQAACMDEE